MYSRTELSVIFSAAARIFPGKILDATETLFSSERDQYLAAFADDHGDLDGCLLLGRKGLRKNHVMLSNVTSTMIVTRSQGTNSRWIVKGENSSNIHFSPKRGHNSGSRILPCRNSPGLLTSRRLGP